LPVRAHPYLDIPLERIRVETPEFGAMDAAYRDVGEGAPLLLVHGLMTSNYSWRYVYDAFARSHRVVIPDLPGCGDSDKPEADYDPRALARWLAAFQRTLGIRGCGIVGNSLGGYISMWLALEDPGATRFLLNLHSPGLPIFRIRALRVALAVPGTHRLLDRIIGFDPKRWAHKNVHYYDESIKSLEEVSELARPLETVAGRRAFACYLREALDPGAMKAFRTALASRDGDFPVPLKLVYAEQDPVVPPVVGERLHKLLPKAEFAWLTDASHLAHIDNPQAFLREALPFVEAHGS
jgi:pimeloyl-ACP methyl ester carboxylesterase